jgi:flagellar biosynthesis component FlhA
VIVCSTRCRLTFSRLAKRVRPQVIVLGMGELPPTSNLSYHQVLCSQAASNSNRG